MAPKRTARSRWIPPVLLALVAFQLAPAATAQSEQRAVDVYLSRTLFYNQCALCHGVSGRGDGPASALLFPPARDFTRGSFKLASTANGVPTEDDLVATLRRGIPGSSMPSWDWMPEEDLRALASHVRKLAIAGMAEDLAATASEEEQGEDWLAIARAKLTPGDPVAVYLPAEPTRKLIATGREVFLANCAACHGEDGKGNFDHPRRDEDRTLNWARDFTAGILKGGATHENLSHRIQVGLHGTAMPASTLSSDERLALVAYVKSLIPDGAGDRLVQRRESIRAARVEDANLLDGEEAVWSEAEEIELALAPLWWRTGAILRARVAALHDGNELAIRIRWNDPTPDAPADLEWPLQAPPYTDAVALQLSDDETPPIFGMGRGHVSTNIWHWRALHIVSAQDLLSVFDQFPHRIGEWLTEEAFANAPFYQHVSAPISINGEAVSTRPAGMAPIEEQADLDGSLDAVPTWNAGVWQVVFTRPLEPSRERELALVPGGELALNLAIWNGSIRDLRGQKSVTIWHTLELEP